MDIKAYPNDTTAFGNLALLYNLFYGQYEKAIPLANEASRLEPAAPFGYIHAGLAYMASKPDGGIAVPHAKSVGCQGGQPLRPPTALSNWLC